MKLSDIKATTKKIEQGAWVRDIPNLPGVAIKTRGYGNADYRRLRAKLHGEMSADQLADVDEVARRDVDLIVETLVQDWSGIEDCPFTKDTARDLLNDPDVAVLRAGIEYAAGVVAREGRDALEADAKN